MGTVHPVENSILLPLSEQPPMAGLQAQSDLLAAVPLLARVLDAIPSMAMVLNPQREIVLANRRMVEFAGAEEAEELRGMRSGDVMSCVHALESCGGCGTTPHCTVCGSLLAVVDAQLGYGQAQVCLMVRRAGGIDEPVALEVWAAPLEITGQHFTLVCLSSAADRLLRERLDLSVLPQAKALAAETEALTRAAADDFSTPDARQRTLSLLQDSSKRLSDVVHAPGELAAAEAGELAFTPSLVSARELLSLAAADIVPCDGPGIHLDWPPEDAEVETDPGLARKVLGQILLNATEAAPPLGGASAGFRVSETHIEFRVHNPGEMARAVQLQVCSRGFSTRAPGRGYGTYLARLVTERYLGGSLTFRSAAGEGTTFTVRLPRAGGTRKEMHD
jgi:signal transduction histidine kinase